MHTALRMFLRTLVFGALAIILVVAGWWLTHRDEVRGIRAALIVAAEFEPVRGSGLARIGTDAPRTAVVRTVGELPATLVRPAGSDTHPALVLLVPNGTTDAEVRDVARLQRGAARAGFAAWAVRAPDPGEGLGTLAGQQVLETALAAIAADDSTRDESISIVAAGPLASQALRAAGGDLLRSRVDGVVAVQPIADVRGVVKRVVLGTVSDDVRLAAGRAIVDVVQRRAGEGASPIVRAALERAASSDDPVAELRQLPDTALVGDLVSVRGVLDARDAASFETAWAAVPQQLRAEVEAVAPAAVAGEITARVLLVVPERDQEGLLPDAEQLTASIDDARLIRAELVSADDVGAARSIADAVGWWLLRARD